MSKSPMLLPPELPEPPGGTGAVLLEDPLEEPEELPLFPPVLGLVLGLLV